MRTLSVKLSRIFVALVISLLATFPIAPATADPAANLITNPGMETSTSGNPDNWATNSWGSNSASFNYASIGHSGGHAAQTTVSNYVDGDAKWMFDPISVTSGNQYIYSDWYEASTTTNLWAQYRNTDGSFSYRWLGSVGASNTWAQSTEKLTVPNGVTAVSIFHVLNANGQLTLDDASLSLQSNCNTSETNGVFNGGFEETCPDSPNVPANWKTETYGSPNASFVYSNSGHTGSHSVQTTMSGSGEAGWQTDWQGAVSNQRYNLNFWHNDTTYIYAYVGVTLNDGSLQYISLMSAPSTQDTGWSQYSDSFVTPDNTRNIQVTIATSGAGTFTLDDVYLNALSNQSPVDFNQGVVTVDFDDGDASTYKNGYPTLSANGIKGTFYINAGTLGAKGYMTKYNLKTLAQNGQEIGSHLYNHVDALSLTNAELQQQITENNNALHTILGSGYLLNDFASPYGSYTSSAIDTGMQYYQSHRTTDGRFNTKANFNPRQIHAILVRSTTTPAQIEAWISQAKQSHQWLVLVYHGIGGTPSGGDGTDYNTTPANFKTEMNYLKSSGANVLTTNSALQQLSAQI